ncbi:uncharacterized protein LOC128327619 isoform X1 [Hemicordylus capensis]|uniref:uncharacterized protein LOC128327619 isoform X1 n=1 Tax=Hemicordylus capensis TaxID=884348 RepID=UPI002302E5B1|nr:uncharacterized protein LOC128327619 isoform X1 [Hemicordylus capensis]
MAREAYSSSRPHFVRALLLGGGLELEGRSSPVREEAFLVAAEEIVLAASPNDTVPPSSPNLLGSAIPRSETEEELEEVIPVPGSCQSQTGGGSPQKEPAAPVPPLPKQGWTGSNGRVVWDNFELRHAEPTHGDPTLPQGTATNNMEERSPSPQPGGKVLLIPSARVMPRTLHPMAGGGQAYKRNKKEVINQVGEQTQAEKTTTELPACSQ